MYLSLDQGLESHASVIISSRIFSTICIASIFLVKRTFLKTASEYITNSKSLVSNLKWITYCRLTFVIAFLGLIYTAILNNKSYLTKTFSGENGDICEIGKENLFLGAAFWCIITIFLGLISYALWVCGSANGKSYQRTVNSANHGDGIVMGQPHTMQ